jgi:anti-sigma factor RsiW
MAPDERDMAGSDIREPHEAQLGALAGYVFGALEPDEVVAVERHLSSCPICSEELPLLRATVSGLEKLPPEALIDGPPDGAELLVRRTVHRIDEQRGQPRGLPRRALAVAAVAAAIAIGSGIVIGRGTAPTHTAGGSAGASTSPTTSASVVPGTMTVSQTDPTTGAQLTATVVPAKGWVRITAKAAGIPAGQRCVLLVVPKRGAPVQAGSWLVSAEGARTGTVLQGTALVPVDQVAAIRVTNTAGHVFVTAAV